MCKVREMDTMRDFLEEWVWNYGAKTLQDLAFVIDGITTAVVSIC